MGESRTSGSGEVWDPRIRRQPADQAVRLLRSRDGHLRGECSCDHVRHSRQLTGGNLGTMWTPPLPRVRVGYLRCPQDYGGGPTDETGGGDTSWIQQRAVEDG